MSTHETKDGSTEVPSTHSATPSSNPSEQRTALFKDFLGIVMFLVCVLAGVLLINQFVFRSFNVEGRSMETTMSTGDRLIVNRIPVTITSLQNKPYIPERGQVIVFKNPRFDIGTGEEYIVKRVIAFPGERVTIQNGHFVVYNNEHPEGFNPDDTNHGEPGSPTSGDIPPERQLVPEGSLFVAGDNREGQNSLDSRSIELGWVPFYDVIGPVSLRIFPLTEIRSF